MRYIQEFHDGNECTALVVCENDGTYTVYNDPPEDLQQMFDDLCDALRGNGYGVIMPSHCKWYEDTDIWSVLLFNEKYYPPDEWSWEIE